MSSKLSRRSFLAATAATAAHAAVPDGLRAAMSIAPAGNSLAAVKHVVIFMQENRSFDHYFGSLKGVRGFNDRTALQLRNGNSVFMQPKVGGSQLPFHLDTGSSKAQCMSGLDHSWSGGHSASNGGKYDNWIAAKGAMTMGYFQRADIPFHYALADAFTICDHYFCSVNGPTDPNRLHLWSGMMSSGKNGSTPITDNSTPGFAWTTYPERLQAAGVSWKVYQKASDNYDDNALAWFNVYRKAKPGNPLYDRGMASVPTVSGDTVRDIAEAIRRDVLGGSLPQVSWVVAPESASEHPSWSPAAGADMINQVLQALTADPAVWASTVLLLDYDENDGFFDHVPPPLPPGGTADEFINGQPIGLGARVPMTVVSPWSRGGYVCSQVFDHTSVIRFLETWTGVQEPNISAWRRKVCGDLTSAFNFSQLSVAVPAMPDTAALWLKAQSQCSTLPAPKAPSQQSQPVQEAGSKPARALPYQPNVNARCDLAGGKIWLDMSNAGSAAVHMPIYANNFRSDGPWQYTVDAGGSQSDYWSAQRISAGKYDLSAYGPNGFLRRFAGNINGVGGQIEVLASYNFDTPGRAQLILTMRNSSSAAVTFTVTSKGYRSDGPWTYTVPAGGSSSDYWNVELYTNCWYDFVVTASADSSFVRRFAGHVETGKESISG
ncbi:phosphocholine-specific phospholipase C [Chitinimonas sp.]|uniref:phosphocholine-specific phospholipase C n=1 Tax=Chitinimonas sp. TaxID=1934313 RepID=UPI0035B3DDD8